MIVTEVNTYVTQLEALRLKQKLLTDPLDPEAVRFFAVLKEWKATRRSA